MCKRTTTDPLLRPLLDTYRVHPLLLPREGVRIGDVYAHAGRSTSQVGHIAHLIDPAPTLPPITEGERMASVSSARSGSYDFRTGVRFLSGFLTHLRAPASFIGGVRSAYERRSAAALDFKIGDLTRDSVDNGALAVCLGRSMVRADQSLWDERQRHYIVSAVWRASALTVRGTTRAGQQVQIGIDALSAAAGNVSMALDHTDGEAITYGGDRTLAVGVEVLEITRDERSGRVRVKFEDFSLGPLRGSSPGPADARRPFDVRAFIGGPDGDAFLTLSDDERGA